MIANSFRSVVCVAGVAAAALSCYMVSLQVAAERSDVAELEARIVAARQEIRSLQTELGTRGRMQQLERWNAEVLALSAPVSGQYVENEVMLARFDARQPSLEERTRVQLASADTAARPAPQAAAPRPASPQVAPPPAQRPVPQLAAARTGAGAEERDAPAQPMVRRAALVESEPAPAAARARRTPAASGERRRTGLIDERTAAEIGRAERAERAQASTRAADGAAE